MVAAKHISFATDLSRHNHHFSAQIKRGSLTALLDLNGSYVGKTILSALTQESNYRLKTLAAIAGEDIDQGVRPSQLSVENLPPVCLLDWRKNIARRSVATFMGLDETLISLITNFGIELCPCCAGRVERSKPYSWSSKLLSALSSTREDLIAISISLPPAVSSPRELRRIGVMSVITANTLFQLEDSSPSPIEFGVIELTDSETAKGQISTVVHSAVSKGADAIALHRIDKSSNRAELLAFLSAQGICSTCLTPSHLKIGEKIDLDQPEILNLIISSSQQRHSISAPPTLRNILDMGVTETRSLLSMDQKIVSSNMANPIFAVARALSEFGIDYLSLSSRCELLSTGERCCLHLARELAFPLQHLLYCFEDPCMSDHESELLLQAVRSLTPGNSVLISTCKPAANAYDEVLNLQAESVDTAAAQFRSALNSPFTVHASFTDTELTLYQGAFGIIEGGRGSGKTRLLREISEQQRAVLIPGVDAAPSGRVCAQLLFSKPLARLLAQTEAARLNGIDEQLLEKVLNGRVEQSAALFKITFREKSITQLLNCTIEDLSALLSSLPKCKERVELCLRLGIGGLRLKDVLADLGSGDLQKLLLSSLLTTKQKGALYLIDDLARHYSSASETIKIIREAIDQGCTVVATTSDSKLLQHADYVVQISGYGLPRRSTLALRPPSYGE